MVSETMEDAHREAMIKYNIKDAQSQYEAYAARLAPSQRQNAGLFTTPAVVEQASASLPKERKTMSKHLKEHIPQRLRSWWSNSALDQEVKDRLKSSGQSTLYTDIADWLQENEPVIYRRIYLGVNIELAQPLTEEQFQQWWARTATPEHSTIRAAWYSVEHTPQNTYEDWSGLRSWLSTTHTAYYETHVLRGGTVPLDPPASALVSSAEMTNVEFSQWFQSLDRTDHPLRHVIQGFIKDPTYTAGQSRRYVLEKYPEIYRTHVLRISTQPLTSNELDQAELIDWYNNQNSSTALAVRQGYQKNTSYKSGYDEVRRYIREQHPDIYNKEILRLVPTSDTKQNKTMKLSPSFLRVLTRALLTASKPLPPDEEEKQIIGPKQLATLKKIYSVQGSGYAMVLLCSYLPMFDFKRIEAEYQKIFAARVSEESYKLPYNRLSVVTLTRFHAPYDAGHKLLVVHNLKGFCLAEQGTTEYRLNRDKAFHRLATEEEIADFIINLTDSQKTAMMRSPVFEDLRDAVLAGDGDEEQNPTPAVPPQPVEAVTLVTPSAVPVTPAPSSLAELLAKRATS